MASEREQWKSRMGFLAAAIGSAIGLGNIWRFSYVCYEKGGGAFLIPYAVALFTAGIPILILEYALGHRLRGSAPAALRRVGKGWEFLGWWAVVFVMFGIELYYCCVISWCCNYFRFALHHLAWGDDPGAFFNNSFLHLSKGPWDMGKPVAAITWGLVVVWLLNWIITARGVQKGVEIACKIFMPLLFVLTLVLVARGVTLPGAAEGVKAYLTPDWAKLKDTGVWMAAYGQIFFSLSVGFGIMIAYASYLPEDADIAANAVITGVVNCLYSFVAGFAVFGALGFMAAQTGKPVAEVVKSGPGLAFVAYPKAISQMPAGAMLFGGAFFLTLIVAGLSSSISILEAFASAVQDKFHVSRFKTCTALCAIGFCGSLVFATRGGLYWLDIVDHFLNSYGLVTVGLLECVLVAVVLGPKMLRGHINRTSSFRVGKWWDACICFLTPVILIIMIETSLCGELRKPYSGYDISAITYIGFGWIVRTLIIAWVITSLPWKKEPAPHTAIESPEIWPPDAQDENSCEEEADGPSRNKSDAKAPA